jgi:hypothetical protein
MALLADTVPLGGLLAVGVILGLFGVVGWICRPRPRRDPKQLALERGHVELTESDSAAGANHLATWLRGQGIVAFACAEEMPPKPRSPQMIEIFGAEAVFLERRYRAFVVVGKDDLDRAQRLLGIVPSKSSRRLRGKESAKQRRR